MRLLHDPTVWLAALWFSAVALVMVAAICAVWAPALWEMRLVGTAAVLFCAGLLLVAVAP